MTATDRRPPQAEDLYDLPSVGSPQISPDGSQVVYTVGIRDREVDKTRSRVWLVATEGGKLEPFSPEDESASSPRWSPDGSRLAYVVSGENGSRLAVQRLGETSPTIYEPSFMGGIGGLVWSPDGEKLAFTSRTVPEPTDTRDTRPQVIDRLRYFHNGSGYVGDGIWLVYLLDTNSGEASAITDPAWHHFQPSWSPDGARLALVTTRRPDWDLEWVWDIYTCRMDGSDLLQLTGSRGVCLAPVWSPDGSRIAYLDNRCPSTGTTVDYHLWSVPADGGEPDELTDELDRGLPAAMLPSDSPKAIWLEDGSGLLLSYRDAGFGRLARVENVTHRVVTLGDGEGVASAPSVSPENGRIAFSWTDAHSLPEIWACEADGSNRRRLTNHTGPAMERFALGEPRAFRLPSPDRFEVESWLTLPPGMSESDGPFPTILELHGGPHGAVGPAFSLRSQLLASNGYAVVAVNFRGSGGYGQAFADLILANWGAKEFEDAMAALDHLVERGIADPERLGVYGGSYGGFMTNYTITHSDRFAAAVTISTISRLDTLSYLTDHWESIDWDNGGYPFERPGYYEEHSPLSNVTKITTPVLILHGEADHTCSVSEADMLFAALRKQGKPVQLVRYPGEAHGFILGGRPSTQVDAHRRLLEWFQQHMPV